MELSLRPVILRQQPAPENLHIKRSHTLLIHLQKLHNAA